MEKRIIELVLGSAFATGAMVMSFFSGHLWMYVYFEFFAKSTKRKSMVDNNYGKVAIGLMWFSFFALPMVLKNNWENLELVSYSTVESVVPMALLFGIFAQGLVSIFVICRVR